MRRPSIPFAAIGRRVPGGKTTMHDDPKKPVDNPSDFDDDLDELEEEEDDDDEDEPDDEAA